MSERQWRSHSSHPPQPDRFDAAGLALVRTCRQIYNETVDILDAHNRFDVDNLLTLIHLADLLLLPQQIRVIQDVNVRWLYFSDPARWKGTVYAPFDAETWQRFWTISVLLC